MPLQKTRLSRKNTIVSNRFCVSISRYSLYYLFVWLLSMHRYFRCPDPQILPKTAKRCGGCKLFCEGRTLDRKDGYPCAISMLERSFADWIVGLDFASFLEETADRRAELERKRTVGQTYPIFIELDYTAYPPTVTEVLLGDDALTTERELTHDPEATRKFKSRNGKLDEVFFFAALPGGKHMNERVYAAVDLD
ncbi:uncharacterized protein EV420DRAFT_1563328 [Desarmillaria tabescens]|uniref:Uncharacterized protein n=1 Tax=Armillaria tabescens TaxID=1929756 RepID=A0AA39JZL8_ARMTA|nr:uncharacterized protein EV420DRAFT_1563328 [Desarmillaria tabescens]KAK0450399.1 hypothetical protein EV420DRAFT_1563328 [Desarmillaria tabescens]